MKIGIVSLGCSKNLVDSQLAMKYLVQQGHEFTDNPRNADVIIVNTCAFINDAKQESIDTILEMAEYKNNNCKKLIVMGCLSQRYKDELEEEIPEVDRFITITEYPHLKEIFKELIPEEINKECELLLATDPWTGYLRISDGCNNNCAFCAIPLIRGRYKSVPMEILREEAKKMADAGVKELNLIAQDSTKYGIDLYGEFKLGELLTELNKMDFHWIRILYLYPDEINDSLLDTIASLDKVIPYFDIPVQHSSDELLRKMYRFSSRQKLVDIVEKIRNKFVDPTLRTTVIVGFPTETEDDFEDLLEFVKETKWDHLGAFAYSREENTPAYDLAPQIAENVKQERLERLMLLQQGITEEASSRYIGSVEEVLVEMKDSLRNIYVGRSKHHAPDDIDGHVSFFSEKNIELGTFVHVKITSVRNYDWQGELADEINN